MKIKVCGLKHPENIVRIQKCNPDFVGFIFFKESPRYVSDKSFLLSLDLKDKSKTVGVFVNCPMNEVKELVALYQLDLVQLHGDETLEYVRELSFSGIKIIKAFQINEDFDWDRLENYSPYVQYFLFDTATKQYGGSGLKFNWDHLVNYRISIPFFLSGGISINDVESIADLNLPQLHGIDINSKFETRPGFKDVELVNQMINKVRNGK